MIDLIALWIGRVFLAASGIGAAVVVIGFFIDWLWDTVKHRAYFLEILVIYMQKGRSAAKAAAAELPRQPYP